MEMKKYNHNMIIGTARNGIKVTIQDLIDNPNVVLEIKMTRENQEANIEYLKYAFMCRDTKTSMKILNNNGRLTLDERKIFIKFPLMVALKSNLSEEDKLQIVLEDESGRVLRAIKNPSAILRGYAIVASKGEAINNIFEPTDKEIAFALQESAKNIEYLDKIQLFNFSIRKQILPATPIFIEEMIDLPTLREPNNGIVTGTKERYKKPGRGSKEGNAHQRKKLQTQWEREQVILKEKEALDSEMSEILFHHLGEDKTLEIMGIKLLKTPEDIMKEDESEVVSKQQRVKGKIRDRLN